jgi:hypothetical protein
MQKISVGILILHAAILCFQLLAMRLFPRQRSAIPGTYLILMPVGACTFMELDSWLPPVFVVAGLAYILYMANRNAVAAAKS